MYMGKGRKNRGNTFGGGWGTISPTFPSAKSRILGGLGGGGGAAPLRGGGGGERGGGGGGGGGVKSPKTKNVTGLKGL